MVKSVYQGTESISYLGPKIWDILPERLKKLENLEHKRRKPDNFQFRLCKVYIESVGFL